MTDVAEIQTRHAATLTSSESRVLAAYAECGKDGARAAGMLGISVAYLNRVMRRIRSRASREHQSNAIEVGNAGASAD